MSLENHDSTTVSPHSHERPTTWKDVLREERQQPYFLELLAFVEAQRKAGKEIFPPNNQVFHALSATPLAAVRAVIIGQDPYHGPGQAHGLCFSVQRGIAPPPSLVNIYKELASDLGIARPNHGCLESWASQGVLLLNTTLTVESGKPASHARRGWERSTDTVIRAVNHHKNNVVFFLWGAHAQKKREMIDATRHLILEAPHPSPLSASRGFLGCQHFSRAQAYLQAHGRGEIDWRVG